MREVGKSLDIDLFVFGPETHMTAIVAMALGETFHIYLFRTNVVPYLSNYMYYLQR